MDPNLDTLRSAGSVLDYLGQRDHAVFRSTPGTLESQMVLWDSEHYPDYRMFPDTAIKTGVQDGHCSYLRSSRTTSKPMTTCKGQIEEVDTWIANGRATTRPACASCTSTRRDLLDGTGVPPRFQPRR